MKDEIMGGRLFFKSRLQAAVLLCIFLQGGAFASEHAQEQNSVYLNLYYGSLHRMRCTGDLYLPNAVTSAPIVVLIHGGGWEAGDKSDFNMQYLTSKLIASGYAVFNINYRLIQDGGRFPYNIQDVRNAITFIVTNAQEFGLDKKRIAVVGESAGGYLALMAGYSADSKLFLAQHQHFERGSISCVVCYYPVTDLVNLERGFVIEYLDDTESHNPQIYKIAEPQNYFATAVPTLIIHGTSDHLVPFDASLKFVQSLRQNRTEAELKVIEGGGHGFKYGDESERAFEATRIFLDSHLKGRAACAKSALH